MKKSVLLIFICLLLFGCGEKNLSSGADSKQASDASIKESKNENNETTTTITVAPETTTTSTTTTTTTTTTRKETTMATTKKSTNTTTSKTTTTRKQTTTSTTKKTTSTTTTTTANSTTTTTQKPLTTSEVYSAMIALKDKYPTGTPWDNSNSYSWKGGYYSTGYGCAGFAFMVSDAAFGSRKAKKHTNFDNIKVGDILRIYDDSHSVIVLSISGDTYTIAEGNLNNAVYWGRKLSLSDIKKTGSYVLTRW